MKRPGNKKFLVPAHLIDWSRLFLLFLTGKVGGKEKDERFPTTQIILQSFLTGVTFHKTNHLPYSESYIDVLMHSTLN